jgi:hypothetical protein
MIEVTMTIDFGPAERSPFEVVVTVQEKSTVLDVLLQRLPVTTYPRYGMDHFVERSTVLKPISLTTADGASRSTVEDLTCPPSGIW